MNVPTWHVSPRPASDRDLFGMGWETVAALPPLCLAESGRPAAQQTTVRLCHDDSMLFLRFDCEDRDIWCTWSQHDQPLGTEEAVELLISPGDQIPAGYYDFQINPNAVVFDARVERGAVDTSWDCRGLRVAVERDDPHQRWSVVLGIPFDSIAPDGARPRCWRANIVRIERPRGGEAEVSCWSPPLGAPADMQRPAAFGLLILSEPSGQEQ